MKAPAQDQVHRDEPTSPSGARNDIISSSSELAESSESPSEASDQDEAQVQQRQRHQGRKLFTHTSRGRLVGEHISVTLAPGVSQVGSVRVCLGLSRILGLGRVLGKLLCTPHTPA